MSEDLVAFLRERLDEDEQEARNAAEELGTSWYYDGYAVLAQPEGDLVATGSQDFLERKQGEFIARHDPARVLAEVAAKRRIIAWHDIPARAAPGPGLREHDRWCVGCGLNNEEEPMVDDINNCPVLRAFAFPYVQHPDFRPEWAPDA